MSRLLKTEVDSKGVNRRDSDEIIENGISPSDIFKTLNQAVTKVRLITELFKY